MQSETLMSTPPSTRFSPYPEFLQERLPRTPANRIRHRAHPLLLAPVTLAGTLALIGCGGTVRIYNGPSTPTPINEPLAGNWQFDATTTAGVAPFTHLTGPLRTASTASATGVATNASLIAASTGCYLGEDFVPLQGTFDAPTLSLFSFSVTGQYLVLQGTADATQTHFTGQFQISGGCADGTSGTVAGTRFDDLTGTYTGTVTGNSAQTISLALTQSATDPNTGFIPVSGTAAFSGISCFTTGTVVNSLLSSTDLSSVSGSFVKLYLTTNDPASTLVVTGTLDPAADTLSVQQIFIDGGACSALLPGATLLRPTT